jgi:predicted RNA-binding Zn-ribbon protein involved in translation (DUF1610 family)
MLIIEISRIFFAVTVTFGFVLAMIGLVVSVLLSLPSLFLRWRVFSMVVPNFFEGHAKFRCLGCGDWFFRRIPDTVVDGSTEASSALVVVDVGLCCPLCGSYKIKRMEA